MTPEEGPRPAVSESKGGEGPDLPEGVLRLDTERGLWGRTYTVSPLVVVGTREGEGYDLAPKHMAMPLGWGGYYGFVCSPRHATYHNAVRSGAFTVSYPRPDQVVLASLAAAPRHGWEGEKPIVAELPTFPATVVDGVLLRDATFFLECELDRVIDGFGDHVLVAGRIVAAHAHEDALILSEEETAEALERSPVLVYLDPGRFAELRTSHQFPLPAGFSP